MLMYGYNYSREQTRTQLAKTTPAPIVTPLMTPNVPVVAPQEPVVEAHAEVTLITRYNGCGHEREQALALEGIVGLKEKQIAALYPLYTITAFSPMRVEMRREVEGVCPSHYLVKLEGGALIIYQRDAEDDSWRRVQAVEDFYLPYGDDALKEGIVFDNMHQIESFLENLEQ